MHDHDGALRRERRYPALAPWFTSAFEGDRATFKHGDMVAFMEGPAVSRYVAPVATLLDGRRSVEEISQASDLDVDHVRRVIAKLENASLIIDGERIPRASATLEAASVAASCWGQLVDVGEAAHRLESSRVAVLGSDRVARLVGQQLVEMGLACSVVSRDGVGAALVDEARGADLLILGPSSVQTIARSVNAQLYEAQTAWLPVFPFNGRYVEIGPLIVPPDSGCFECFLLRRQANVTYSAEVYDFAASASADRARDYAPLAHASAATAAFVAHQWLAVRHPEMPGVSYLERAGSWERETHHLLRVPRCPVCSPAAERGIPAAWWSTP